MKEFPAHETTWKDPAWLTGVRHALTRWFDRNQRQLPWRETGDPYKIWVSEVMLQQTQVATVIDYFNRFVQRFPTVSALANAEIDEVLSLWEGLGYYRRARQMHAAAQKVISQHNGIFPTSFDDVLSLPGIGRYTAGAILSISGDQKLPVVEANTVRLYSRLVALRNPPAETPSMRLLWAVSESLLPEKRCGRFNQAAMELGSLICKPRNPDCNSCPLEKFCQARRLGLQESIPGQVKKITYEDRRHIALVISNGDEFFMRICQPGTHWEGLWDFPRFDVTGVAGDALDYVRQQLAAEFGWQVGIQQSLVSMRHGVTRYRIALTAHLAVLSADNHPPSRVRENRTLPENQQGWFTTSQISRLPMNTTGRKIAKLLLD